MIVADCDWFVGARPGSCVWTLDDDGLAVRVSLAHLPRNVQRAQLIPMRRPQRDGWPHLLALDTESASVTMALPLGITLTDLWRSGAEISVEVVGSAMVCAAHALAGARASDARTVGDIAIPMRGPPVVVPRLTLAQRSPAERAPAPWFLDVRRVCRTADHINVLCAMANAFGVNVPSFAALDDLERWFAIRGACPPSRLAARAREMMPAESALLDDVARAVDAGDQARIARTLKHFIRGRPTENPPPRPAEEPAAIAILTIESEDEIHDLALTEASFSIGDDREDDVQIDGVGPLALSVSLFEGAFQVSITRGELIVDGALVNEPSVLIMSGHSFFAGELCLTLRYLS